MGPSIEHARAKVREWVEKHRRAVLYDEEGSTLVDVASGKAIHLPWHDLKACDEKAHPETRDTYIVLLLDNGNQLALVDPGGIAFSPSDANTGPLRDLPSTVCLQDFHILKQRIDHYLYAHRDEPPPRECLDLVMIGIAILDGARRVGFDVGGLEAELDTALRELERRRS